MINILRLKEVVISSFYGIMLTPFLGKAGNRLQIYNPLKIDGLKNIYIGNNVRIGYKSWLSASTAISKNVKLTIGNGCAIGGFNHIFATGEIKIGNNVLTADKVYISDNLHNYENIEIPIIKQAIKQINSVEIGDGTWIGENACIIGAKIGRNCVIGANSVVTKDIPDYSVAVGVPAKIIKRFDTATKQWKKTNHIGDFIYD